ncbi:MAG: ATP-dependent Clp protease adaptor ClpS [Rhodobacteraceae bacterium]|nr:ATP-dependent Clp protease adaptor ClpS [Paracoccaceae bacterium]
MTGLVVMPRSEARLRPARPPLYRVLLLNDDFTPRAFVVGVLKAVFRLNADQARRVMMLAHTRGLCVVAVYTRDVAETKAAAGTEAGRREGYPLTFSTEPESSEEDEG